MDSTLAIPDEAQFDLLELPRLSALFVLIEASVVTAAHRTLDFRQPAPSAAVPVG